MAKSGGELKNEKRGAGAHGMRCGLQVWRQSVKALCASGHRRTGDGLNYKKINKKKTRKKNTNIES